MIITVTGRHLDVTAAIKEHAQERSQKLLKHYDLIKEIEVILDGSADKQKAWRLLSAQNIAICSSVRASVKTCMRASIKQCISWSDNLLTIRSDFGTVNIRTHNPASSR